MRMMDLNPDEVYAGMRVSTILTTKVKVCGTIRKLWTSNWVVDWDDGVEIEIDESDLTFLNKAAWKKAFKDAELDKNFVLVFGRTDNHQ